VAPGVEARIRYQMIESGTGAAVYYVDVDRQHLVLEVRQADSVGEPEAMTAPVLDMCSKTILRPQDFQPPTGWWLALARCGNSG